MSKNIKIAKQLLFLARELVGYDFPSQESFDKYMKEHPDADRSNHTVKKPRETADEDEVGWAPNAFEDKPWKEKTLKEKALTFLQFPNYQPKVRVRTDPNIKYKRRW